MHSSRPLAVLAVALLLAVAALLVMDAGVDDAAATVDAEPTRNDPAWSTVTELAGSDEHTVRREGGAAVATESSPAPDVEVPAEPTAQSLRATGRIEGWLTVSGAPVPGWVVVLSDCRDHEQLSRATTDATGAFAFPDAASGTYALLVDGAANDEHAAFPSPWARPLRPVVVEHERDRVTRADVELADPFAGTSITGRVIDQFGEGVGGIVMRVESVTPRDPASIEMVEAALARPHHRGIQYGYGVRHHSASVDTCDGSAEYVDARVGTNEGGYYRFEGLAPGPYLVQLVPPSDVFEHGDSEWRKIHAVGWMAYVDMRHVQEWPIGDLEVHRQVSYEVAVRVVDASGVELGASDARPRVHVLCGNIWGQLGKYYEGGLLRFELVIQDHAGGPEGRSLVTVEAQVQHATLASDTFDVYALAPDEDGVRRTQITLTLP